MSTSRRQALFDAVVLRFGGIRTAAGYDTNSGMSVFAWRDTQNVPFTTEELVAGALNIRDPDCKTEQGGPNILGKHHHTLSIVVEGAVSAGVEAKLVRQMISDLIKATGVDRKWGGIAYDTKPGGDQILVAQNGTTIVGFSFNFSIEFRTTNFDPYNP